MIDALGRRFARRLSVIVAVGLVVRLSYVLFIRRDHRVWGDSFTYHAGANLLADGKWFIGPLQYSFGATVESADHPPLYTTFLAIPSVLGLRSPLTHLVWSALLGTATVVLVGLLGRKVGGPGVGLVAAAIAAVYPHFWVWDGALLSETAALFVVTLVLLLTYRALEEPSLGRVAALGAACAVAALARSELVLLAPALLLPVILGRRQLALADRLRLLGVGTLTFVIVLAPWVGYNLARFERPVFLSSQLEQTLAGANCRDTYEGYSFGYVTATCLRDIDPFAEQSIEAQRLRDRTTNFVGDHLSTVPSVVAARLGRVIGVYRPAQQVDFDVIYEGKERWLTIVAAMSYALLAILAVVGGIGLRRRRRAHASRRREAPIGAHGGLTVPLFPLLVPVGVVLFTVALTVGTTRLRASAEPTIVVLAAVAIESAWRAYPARRARVTTASIATTTTTTSTPSTPSTAPVVGATEVGAADWSGVADRRD